MKIRHLTKIYLNKNDEKVALNNISLDLEECGFIFVLGSSGCGKSTLLECIAGLKDYAGEIEDVSSFEYLTQEFYLFETMSVFDNLRIVKNDVEMIERYLQEFDLLHKKNSKVNRLSNGEKKRVQFIRSLLVQAKVLLCDEITAALDYENTKFLMEKLKEISKDTQIIFVTHDVLLAKQYGDRIIRLECGKVVSDERIHDTDQLVRSTFVLKKNSNDTIKLVLTELKSRWFDTLLSVFILVLCVMSMFCMLNLSTSIQRQGEVMHVFNTSSNLVVSYPEHKSIVRIQTTSGRKVSYDEISINDLFLYKQTKSIIEKNQEIIGVEMWNSTEYGDLSYEKRELEFKAYETFPIDAVKEVEEGTLSFLLADCPIEQPIVTTKERRLTNFKDYIKELNQGRVPYYEDYVSSFDLVNGYTDLPILYGRLCEGDEVVISKDVAKRIMELEGYSDMESIVGKSMCLNMITYKGLYADEPESNLMRSREIFVPISGIANIENEYMKMIFFNSGFGNNPLYKEVVKDTDYLIMDYVRFLLEPGCDYEKVAEKIRDAYAKEHVNIEVFHGDGLGKTKPFYKSVQGLVLYGLCVVGVLVLLLVFKTYFAKQRIVKERRIMRQYGYDLKLEGIVRSLLIGCVCYVVCVASMHWVVEYVNAFALEHMYQPFMEVSFGFLSLVWLVCIVVSISLERMILGK